MLYIAGDWCPICKETTQTFKSLTKNSKNNAKIIFAELDINSFEPTDKTIAALKHNFGITIQEVPTFIIIKKQKVRDLITGIQTADELTALIKNILRT